MTISFKPDLNGFAGHVREPAGKRRLLHVTGPEPSPELARAAAKSLAGHGAAAEGGRFGWEDEELAEAS